MPWTQSEVWPAVRPQIVERSYDDLVLFLHAFTPLITFGLICNSFRFACFVNSSLRFLIPNSHPICTCSCLFTPLTEGRSAWDLTQAATSQKKKKK